METEPLTKYAEPEEGEIIGDDPEELYVPLERPHIPAAPVTIQQPSNHNDDNDDEDDDDDHTLKESSSDSDSSSHRKNSKIRKKITPLERNISSKKRKKYNIWCNDLQTEVLTNSLVDCTVDKSNERCRDVESYNYKLGIHNNDHNKFKSSYSHSDKKKQYLGKRRHDGANVEGKKGIKDVDKSKTSEPTIANARNILGLSTTIENSEEEIAKDMANKLCEDKEELILRALNVIGKESVISLFEETREIEATGGMLVMNGTRRRTPGGVFFYLLKSSETIPRDKIDSVLNYDKKNRNEEKKLSAKKLRQLKAAKFKQALSKDDFPTLLSRTELAIKEFKARKLTEDSAEVTNPPPSPVTDGKDNSSDGEEQKEGSVGNTAKLLEKGRTLTLYDDNLFGEEDVMEVM